MHGSPFQQEPEFGEIGGVSRSRLAGKAIYFVTRAKILEEGKREKAITDEINELL